jgi:ketosteroid isomerase-like protein
MTNLELAKQAYQYFADGNIEGVLSLFDPKIEWHECKGFPFIEGDGRFNGPQAVAENIFAMIPEYYDWFKIDIEELIHSDDRVIMAGYYRGVWKQTGHEFKANATHVLTIKNGKLSRFFQAVDTATILNPVEVKKTV